LRRFSCENQKIQFFLMPGVELDGSQIAAGETGRNFPQTCFYLFIRLLRRRIKEIMKFQSQEIGFLPDSRHLLPCDYEKYPSCLIFYLRGLGNGKNGVILSCFDAKKPYKVLLQLPPQ